MFAHKSFLISLSLLLVVLSLSGCSPAKFAIANAPSLVFDGTIINDIAYGSHKKQTLDVYVPTEVTENTPAIIFYHGGRWTFGNKNQYKFIGTTLANAGNIVIVPNTRLYPDIIFPTFVEDAANVVAWTINNIQNYGGSGDVFLAGHSSGAHMASLLLADDSYLAQFDISPSAVNGFIGLAGPYDFTPKADDVKQIFNSPEHNDNLVVSNFIDGDEPPMLLIYSKNDETVHISNLQKLRDKIQQKDGIVETILYETGKHAGTVAALSWANPDDLPVLQDMTDFISRYQD